MSNVTEFGKWVRKLRLEHGETMLDMGQKLGRSASFLSAMETGRKPVPAQIISAIAETYGLDDSAVSELREKAASGHSAFRLKPDNDSDRELVAAFAAQLESLSEKQRKAIWSALKDS
ncbi:helix-turn-helix transcriptional regulator [Burkholderia cenocepacia]|uniref:helix-turn-helix domain-containing protein n=1 Tax=Burkholderia cenocepacia TaxID=95486 RepID=UPI0028562A94|nr:helix-turn-helix transcriptional regulator [Burkholderia cenocepacia]MDR8025602.1 helix-turn-helix transcriptional regulator [Burkholderia cenocepacia]MDR8042842.1 helix-turn-helix transcriptional regulator [Burkholderia cenocepacia]